MRVSVLVFDMKLALLVLLSALLGACQALNRVHLTYPSSPVRRDASRANYDLQKQINKWKNDFTLYQDIKGNYIRVIK